MDTICNIMIILIRWDLLTLRFDRLNSYLFVYTWLHTAYGAIICSMRVPNLTRNSSGEEIANVNFLYGDIVHALKIQ